MDYRLILRQLGLLVLVLSGLLLAIWCWSVVRFELMEDRSLATHLPLLMSAGVGLTMAGILWVLGRTRFKSNGTGAVGRREALLLVSSSWILGAVVAAVPFLLWARMDGADDHPFRSVINCYFEAMSGLTTTGATVLTDISSLPEPLLLWRALIQWLGGLGIIVLFVAVLPSLGVGGKKLFRVEAPGPDPEGVRPHIRETARLLWVIYVCLTLVEIIAYRIAGMGWFDATCHSFTTLATGGFSTHQSSIGAYNSRWIDTITILFMVLAGANFGLYYAAVKGRMRIIWKDPEFRFYMFLLAAGSTVIVCALLGSGEDITTTTGVAEPATIQNALTNGVFTAVSIQTNTGFTTADYDTWPFAAKAVIVMMMFIGGCAGSTGGGIKVIRIWIAIKVMLGELERAFRPNVVRPLRVGTTAIDPDLKLATIAYVLGVVVLFAAGAGTLMLLESGNAECDFTTAAAASLATVCTVGPGLAKVGAMENYLWFSDASKLVLCLLMAIGRLEVFAILVLLTPRFWMKR
ncbi:MAG: TrkH family potassium uptake protein [Phycisphaerales bacterium]|jgi:trk system potassium uptake protein TrkH|nr:TrkH family potassium uptake protein [Phycisphaerales bacterium]